MFSITFTQSLKYLHSCIYINEYEPEMKKFIPYKAFKIFTQLLKYIKIFTQLLKYLRLHILYILDPPRLIYNISDPRAIYRPRRSRVPIYCPRVRYIVYQPRGSPIYTNIQIPRTIYYSTSKYLLFYVETTSELRRFYVELFRNYVRNCTRLILSLIGRSRFFIRFVIESSPCS